MGEVDGRKLVFFCGGDGICYAFDAVKQSEAETDEVIDLHCVWRYDGDPTAPKEDVHQYIRNRRESPSNVKSMPVFYGDRIYFTLGGDIWWGKREAWLKCVDATLEGDITAEGTLWSYPLSKHCSSTPAIHDGLAYVADCGGNLHCLNAENGHHHWSFDLGRETWSSPLVADGKVYIGTRGGDFWILEAGKEKKLLGSVDMGTQITSSPEAANGVLYVTTLERLYAIAKE
jgi:outer membrane protein assembly factor BamB